MSTRPRRQSLLHLSLTHDHHARLRVLADHSGMTRSEMVRRMIDDAFCTLYPVRPLQPPPGVPMPGSEA